MLKIILLFFLALAANFNSYSQGYFSRYLIKSHDLKISYPNTVDDESTDFQTYMLDQFFYGSIIKSWVTKDRIFQRVFTTFERQKEPKAGVSYVDSFGQKGLSGKVINQTGLHGTIKLTLDSNLLSQAVLIDKKNNQKINFYTNTDTGITCASVSYVKFKATHSFKVFGKWHCQLWIPTNNPLIDKRIEVWICPEIPTNVQFCYLGQNFPGGIVRIDLPYNGYYYQLLDFKPIGQEEIPFRRSFDCQKELSDYNFVKEAIWGKKGLDLKYK